MRAIALIVWPFKYKASTCSLCSSVSITCRTERDFLTLSPLLFGHSGAVDLSGASPSLRFFRIVARQARAFLKFFQLGVGMRMDDKNRESLIFKDSRIFLLFFKPAAFDYL